MILVDSSVWIEFLAGRRRFREDELLTFVTCGPVVQEVLQGLRPGPQSEMFRESLLAMPVAADPIPLRLFLAAADIYREGHRRGLTIRSSADCLIAAIAIDLHLPVWHRDRDFEAIARYTPLASVSL
jgi:predicted nucleic acid-binding protein